MLIQYLARQAKLAFRHAGEPPRTQAQLAALVDHAIRHEIRQGRTHRFIALLFVTVGERVFCRRYTYGEPSWHSAFAKDPEGQLKLDKTVVDIQARQPHDLEQISPLVNHAYEAKLRQLGASHMLSGATDARALASTMELTLQPR